MKASAVERSDQRYCWDGFEIRGNSDERVNVVICLECYDRQAIPFATTTAGASGELLRDVIIQMLVTRFGPVESLSGNRSVYIAYDTCGHCHVGVKIAPVLAQILPRSNVSSRLLAHLITSKFVDGLPFYRTQTVLARHDIALPRGTQAAAVIRAYVPVIPLMNLMDERLRATDYIRIDETSMQVLKSEASSIHHQMWVRVAGPPGQRLILFDHDPSGSSQVAIRLLDGTRGYVQSDGYAAYNTAAASLQLTHVGCFAHARSASSRL